MKALVLGASGMAGHVVATHLREQGYEISTTSGSKKLNDTTTLLDITDQLAFLDFLDGNQFDFIINCVGVLIKQSDERKDISSYLNSFLPHMLEYRFRDTKTKIIHLSTDCVFSGQNAPYLESSPYDGMSFYDRSKALGEIINDKDLTFRMSIIGPDMQANGIGLFNWFMAQSGEIQGWRKAIWNGITTITLAHAIDCAIKQGLTGLYHLVPNYNISKYELLQLFRSTMNRDDITITPVDNESIDKTLVNSRTDFSFEISDYSTQIDEMRRWINNHNSLYGHYENS